MSNYVVQRITDTFRIKKNKKIKKILVMGLSFKENCPDTRNSKTLDVCRSLIKKNFEVHF